MNGERRDHCRPFGRTSQPLATRLPFLPGPAFLSTCASRRSLLKGSLQLSRPVFQGLATPHTGRTTSSLRLAPSLRPHRLRLGHSRPFTFTPCSLPSLSYLASHAIFRASRQLPPASLLACFCRTASSSDEPTCALWQVWQEKGRRDTSSEDASTTTLLLRLFRRFRFSLDFRTPTPQSLPPKSPRPRQYPSLPTPFSAIRASRPSDSLAAKREAVEGLFRARHDTYRLPLSTSRQCKASPSLTAASTSACVDCQTAHSASHDAQCHPYRHSQRLDFRSPSGGRRRRFAFLELRRTGRPRRRPRDPATASS